MNVSKSGSNDKSFITTVQKYIPDQILAPHEFTRNTQLAFNKIINDISVAQKSKNPPQNYLNIIRSFYRGRLQCNTPKCFHVTVSISLVNRAMHILDTLAKELENRKFKIQFHQDNMDSFVTAFKANECVSFRISEGYKYHPIKNELRSELEKLLYRDKEPIPTGKLTLSISARETNIGKSWTDGVRLIEDMMPGIMNSFDSLVLKQKQLRVENASKANERREYARIFRENESKYYAEKSIYDSAMQDSQSFTEHKNLEEYLNYLEAQFLKEYGCLNEATRAWFSTVRKIADSQSLINKRLKILSTL